jgi:LAGLIDADG DNA endonuclease family
MLTTTQQQFLIGSLLGDTHIEYNGTNCRARFDHSIKQLEYLEWKRKMLAPYLGPISKYTVYDKRTNKTYQKARFSTYSLPFFNFYQQLFYQNGKKIVPTNIKSIFHSSLALAVWYLDDGSLKTDCRAFRLHTNNFTLSEVEILKARRELNFNLKSKLHKQSNYFILYVGSRHSEAKKFSNIIRPLVESEIPSMLYKFF